MSEPFAVINEELIEELKDIMDEGFQELVTTFLTDGHTRIAALQNAIEHENPARFREFSHALKGSSANLGAEHLAEICYSAEVMGASGDLSKAPATLDSIKVAFNAVESQLLSMLTC